MSDVDAMEKEYSDTVSELRTFFRSGQTKMVANRKAILKQVVNMLEDNFEALGEAVLEDLGGGPNMRKIFEASPLAEAREAYAQVAKWSKPVKGKHTKLSSQFFGSTKYAPQPKGVVLIIAPWNFPVGLLLAPMVSALAAGNTVVLKPSEIAPVSAQLMQDLVEKYLDPKWIRIVQGGIPETTALLRLKWDHIFYTGNGIVARIIMEAAAKHLTPVTLELGGKSPCIVDKSAKLESAAERIVMGKYLNNGQICAAPDYVLVHESVAEKFNSLVVEKYKKYYSAEMMKNGHPYHGKMVNANHAKRVQKHLDNLSEGAQILVQGEVLGTVEEGFVRPTVVFQPAETDSLMQEEIFGPILPIRTFSSLTDCTSQIAKFCETPLCMYIFAEDKAVVRKVLKLTQSGQVAVNATLDALTVEHFGGIGSSGTGAYHGKPGFDELSYVRPVTTVENSIMSGGPIGPPEKGGYPALPYNIAKTVTLYPGKMLKLVGVIMGKSVK